MLRTLKELHDYTIGAADGDIGHVKDLYLDDEAWVVRYLVVETGGWLSGRRVLISPMAIGEPDWSARLLPVSITQAQVENSPDVDSEKPVTRQHEMDYATYYGYPAYWGGVGYWGAGMVPGLMLSGYEGFGTAQDIQPEALNARAQAEAGRDKKPDPHLRSGAAITGYDIHASDGDIGHVSGMLIDDETWAVRYLVVDTSNWWIGHQTLVAPQWIEAVSWADRTVSVGLTRQAIKDAPVYDPSQSFARDNELRLHRHYGRDGYWEPAEVPATERSRV
ncbi:MAG: PRC-barrel domain-containing protein [Rubrivivax sp.]